MVDGLSLVPPVPNPDQSRSEECKGAEGNESSSPLAPSDVHGEPQRPNLVTCYLDESGTDDLSPAAVVAGVMLDEERFLGLGNALGHVLAKHRIPSPLHMKKFPVDMPVANKRAFFSDLVTVVNKHKILSLSAVLTTQDFESHLSGVVDKHKVMGVYGFCFLLALVMNKRIVESAKSNQRTPFVMDRGNDYKDHILAAHKVATEQQDGGIDDWKLGPLTFASDTDIAALQAADVIAWTTRRQMTKGLGEGLEPLAGLFDDDHFTEPVSASAMQGLANCLS